MTKTEQECFKVRAKKRLLEMDLTIQGLADKLGLTRHTVSLAINNPTLFRPTKRRIATFLRIKP